MLVVASRSCLAVISLQLCDEVDEYADSTVTTTIDGTDVKLLQLSGGDLSTYATR